MAESTKALFTGGASVNPTLDQRNFYVDPKILRNGEYKPVISLANLK